jgi:asparagine synthase (glutamine-hydrolysing)
MCGIWAAIAPAAEQKAKFEACLATLYARGPEGHRLTDISGIATLGFTRLAINGLTDQGMQPFTWTAPDGRAYTWICNGEIYNWRALAAEYDFTLESGSDCEIIGPLFHALRDNPAAFARALDGVFAIVLVDMSTNDVIVTRDPYGVRPLYMGYMGSAESPVFSSEQKGFAGLDIEERDAFPPGNIAIFRDESEMFIKYHTVPYDKIAAFSNLEVAEQAIERGLRAAVRKRLMTERPCAALLSGGIDSSLIAALVADELRIAGVEKPLETFSIGFEGSEDLRHARMVADWIGSDHHEITMTPDEFFAAIPEVVKAIESYDVTTVRASVGNYLVSRAIKEKSDCKVVFNGDGADEIFGSYLYFYGAPSDAEFERETERLLEDIHYFDVLRSDRSISSNGLEPRTPFLDKGFVAVAKGLPTKWRRPGVRHGGCMPTCEKWILRRAFESSGLLPPEVLWRRKEAFSDGVSGPVRSWYEEIQERVSVLVPADWAVAKFDHLPPATAEAFYYRQLFEQFFGPGRDAAEAAVPYRWMPRWSPGATDPSARTLGVYGQSVGT